MTITQGQPQKIELNQITATLKTFKETHHMDTFLGAMMTTQGILLIFFSHRFNRELPLIVSGTETSKVLQEVSRVL